MKPHAAQRDLVWLAPWQNPSGYCSEALAFALGLGNKRPLELVEVAKLRSTEFVAGLPEATGRMLREKLRASITLAGKILIQHLPASGFAPAPQAAWTVGRTMFETDRLPADWAAKCNLLDEIWVPSQFNLETFAASGVAREKLHVVPEAVDETLFNPDAHEPWPLPHKAGYNFLSMFEWSARKGWDVLLASYLREFTAEDDACLYLRVYLTNRPEENSRDTITARIQKFAATLGLGAKAWPRIEILDRAIPTRDLPRLYRAVDCLVAPSRGEGWGRPHHEAMMMGVPVINTNWSGNTAFMTEENSYPLDFELVEATQVEAEFAHYRGHRWALASETHLRELMRRVQQKPEEARERGQKGREFVREHFSLRPVAEILIKRIEAIEERLATKARAPRECVVWEGSYLDHGSLSHVNRELTRALQEGSEFDLSRVPNGAQASEGYEALAREVSNVPPSNAALTVRHAWPPNWKRPARGKLAVIQPWEFGMLPEEWVCQARDVDEFWVPSQYVRNCYVESGVAAQKVFVVPNGVDPEKFCPEAAPMKLATSKDFKFLFVGGTIGRKGPDLLLQAYLKNFTAADDVCLVIKDFGGKGAYAGQTFEAQIRAAQSLPNAPEILYLNDELPPESLPGLYTGCDCLVLPYRGEGFGLPALEAMACGRPIIVTRGGATDDFARDAFAWRIPSERKNIGQEVGGMKLAGMGWLLEPNLVALGEFMRAAFGHPSETRARGRLAAAHAREFCSWRQAAEIVTKRLRELTRRAGAEKKAPVTITLPPCALLGDLKEARELLNRKQPRAAWDAAAAAIKLRPFHPEGYLLLAEIALEAGDGTVARQCAQHAKSLAPDWAPAKKFLKGSLRGQRKHEWMTVPCPAALPRLTVCLIVKNEEKFLSQCLASIQDIAAQIVVVDTGSTDRTIAIAKSHGAKVHHFAWNDDFSAARNHALAEARGDWILSLDADEELAPEHKETLRREMESAGAMAYRMPMLDKGREQDGCSYVPRLFRNAPGLFFLGRVHEQVFSSILTRCQQWGLKHLLGKAVLWHHGYTAQVMADRNKIERNLRLLERAIEELPDEPNLLMSLGLELVRSGKPEAGLERYWEALRAAAALPAGQVTPELRESLLTQLTTNLIAAKRFAEIVQLWQTPFAKAGGMTASQHFSLGLAYMELKQPIPAAEQMGQCLAKRELPALSPINRDILKGAPAHCLALCLASLQKNDAAEECFRAAIAADPKARAPRFDFARFLAEAGKPIDALRWLNELVAENAGDLDAWRFGGQVALSQPEFKDFACDWTGEAVKHLGQDPVILLQRAEALFLGRGAEPALPLWRDTHLPRQARVEAARTLCEILQDDCPSEFSAAEERVVSQEALKWYRRLIAAGATGTVRRLHEKMERVRLVLPGFVSVWESATRQAAAVA